MRCKHATSMGHLFARKPMRIKMSANGDQLAATAEKFGAAYLTDPNDAKCEL
jgi:hypothetical protein